jgi:hypothetical protein
VRTLIPGAIVSATPRLAWRTSKSGWCQATPDGPGRSSGWRPSYAPPSGGLAVAVEHVGSTAVPELAAKPIVDIAIGLAPGTNQDRVITTLQPLLQSLVEME